MIYHLNHLFFWQTIHMKCQDMFSLKNKKNKIKKKLSSVGIVIGTLRVNCENGKIFSKCVQSP